MIKVEPCAGCGRMILVHPVANLTVKCDPTPLDGRGVGEELTAGRQLWTPGGDRLKAARPGDPKLLREHRCTNRGTENLATAAQTAPQPPKAPGVPANPPVRPRTGSRRFSGQSTTSSTPGSVRTAPIPASEPRCSACSQPMADGTYAAIQVGEIIAWAQHVTDCRGGNP